MLIKRKGIWWPCSAWHKAYKPRRAAGIGQLSKKEAKATPLPFRDLLLSIARSNVNE